MVEHVVHAGNIIFVENIVSVKDKEPLVTAVGVVGIYKFKQKI